MPASAAQANEWAAEREAFAKLARENDLHGSARELELTALLLRAHACELTTILEEKLRGAS